MVPAMVYNNLSAALIRLKKTCRDYFRDVMEISIRAILLLISTAVFSLLVLYFYSILWHIFRITYSGKKFSMLHPKATSVISNIVNNDLIELSIHTTFSAFAICLVIGAICQVSYITRFLYYPRSIIAKLLFWGIPLTAVVSMYINDQIQLAHWSYTMPVTIVPTLCVFTYCFKFSETLLPEIGDVIAKIFHGLKVISRCNPSGNRNSYFT
jgi:hypothetical protein